MWRWNSGKPRLAAPWRANSTLLTASHWRRPHSPILTLLDALRCTYKKRGGHILQAKSFSLSSPFSDIPTCSRSIFHSPYTLPSSVSRKFFIYHSCENSRGVYQQFPIWNSPGSRVLRSALFFPFLLALSARLLRSAFTPTGSGRLRVILFSSAPNFQPSTVNFQPPPSTPSFLTKYGIITCRNITGSGHTFTCRPRCPPCGLIQASLGTSPLLRIK